MRKTTELQFEELEKYIKTISGTLTPDNFGHN